MPLKRMMILNAYRIASLFVYGSAEEANWIYEKIQNPSSFFTVALNVLYWKLRLPRVHGFVAMILEPVFDCNLRCKYCPWTLYPERLTGRRPQLISWETFTLAIDRAPRSIETVQLAGMGEPTLHPRIADIIEYIADHGFRPSMFTNGTMLKGDTVQRVASTRLDVLNISLEPDDETCREFRGVRLDLVRRNIESFVQSRKYPTKVKIRIVAHAGNIDRLADVRDSWDGLVDDFKVCPQFTMNGKHDSSLCLEPWRGNVNVWTNGVITPCCLDTFEDFQIGDIHRDTITDALKSAAFKDLLRRFVRGDVPERCAKCEDVKLPGLPSLIPRRGRSEKTPPQ